MSALAAGGTAGRYLRHDLIDWFSQAEVSASRVAVIGAGAIGNEVVKNLALLGVGHIDVYDFDRVELHNLTRSILLRESDVGRPKAQALIERAGDIDPNCKLRAFDGDLRDLLNPSQVAGYRAVVGAVDNFEARLRLNQLCLLAGVDFINAAIDSRYVSVETFAHSQWNVACYECHLPDSAYARLAERYSCGGLRSRAFDEKKIPTTAITASLAGALASAAALRLGGPTASRRAFMDTHRMSSQSGELGRQPGCACCAAFERRPERLSAEAALAAVRPAAEQPSGDEACIVLPEPVIVACACRQCGRDHSERGDAQASLLGRRARDFDDRLTWCTNCRATSVDVELRDRFSAAEFEACLSRASDAVRRSPVPFALLQDGGQYRVIEWPIGPADDSNTTDR